MKGCNLTYNLEERNGKVFLIVAQKIPGNVTRSQA